MAEKVDSYSAGFARPFIRPYEGGAALFLSLKAAQPRGNMFGMTDRARVIPNSLTVRNPARHTHQL